MWLLNCETYHLESFEGEYIPPYAILSHRWEGKEVAFSDVTSGEHTDLPAWRKIKACCDQATLDGLKYVWADTCCIDKRSSAELSEAINSMYEWYRRARVCYAYLVDVSADADIPASNELPKPDIRLHFGPSELTQSVWFTRGWTLQELLAPRQLEFYDHRWRRLGWKSDFATVIQQKTGIPKSAFEDFKSTNYCIAEKMSWAAQRQTSRLEDRTYSLLGIFDVNMPLLYGEGDKAFIRFQEELIRTTNDNSVYAWTTPAPESTMVKVLASSPNSYRLDFSLHDMKSWEFDAKVLLDKVGLSGKYRIQPFCFEVYVISLGRYRVDPYPKPGVMVNELVMFVEKFDRETTDNVYRRVILDGKASEIIPTGLGAAGGWATLQWQVTSLTIDSGSVKYRSSAQFPLDDYWNRPVPGYLSQTKLPWFVRKLIRTTHKRFRKIENDRILVALELRDEFIPCLVFPVRPRHPDPPTTPYLLLFVYNIKSEPVAILERMDRVLDVWEDPPVGGPPWEKDTTEPIDIKDTYQGRALTLSAPVGRDSAELASLGEGFEAIEREEAQGAKVIRLGEYTKVIFIPTEIYGDSIIHQILLASKPEEGGRTEHFLNKCPRRWLYPAP